MKCDICGCEENYVKEYEHNYSIKNKTIKFVANRRFCKKCNNLIYDSILDNNASIIAINKYNELYGITKEDIISLRKKYNLSQDLFAKVIGCAKKTLISYEKGKSIPNDSYLIILKSLFANPESIKFIIESNKVQFTDKELKKLSNNIKQLVFNQDNKLNEYNGYKNISKEKIFNIILFLSDKKIHKTKLLKEMFYIDFLYYKNNCTSLTGLEYTKLKYGPVPDQFENILTLCSLEENIKYDIEFIKDYECYNILALKKFNNKIFTKEELVVLNKVKNKFKMFKSKEIVEYSHKEKAFINTNLLDKISYDYSFDIEM